MSDILIKGMEMPDKAATIVIFPEGKVRVFRQDIDHDEWLRATAIEVSTPYGRLIDADELHKKALQRAEKIGDYYNCVGYVISAFDIENAQTIIPAVSEERGGVMAEIKVPVIIDGFKCVEDIVETVLNYTYKGKTLKEWADSISSPRNNADRIRGKDDEELAAWLNDRQSKACLYGVWSRDAWLDWPKQEVDT